VTATADLLERAQDVGVERFVYTSSLWTVGAGTQEHPADEDSAWNLDCVRCPYCATKREAEGLVLERNVPGFHTMVLCPGLVIGPRDVRMTSTRVLLSMARRRILFLPRGGIPVIDAGVLALAHRRVLECGEPGQRSIVAGPYLSYTEMAALVAQVTGRPKLIRTIPDFWKRPLAAVAGHLDRWTGGRLADFSAAAVAGAFLRLHATGRRADSAFGLAHPDPLTSIAEALSDHWRSGRASWLRLREPFLRRDGET
jgi:dihydroflavonol-4-reductase